MSLLADFEVARRAIEAEPLFSRTATVHHPKCPLAQPVFVTASWARSPVLSDCTCGGAAFPVRSGQ